MSAGLVYDPARTWRSDNRDGAGVWGGVSSRMPMRLYGALPNEGQFILRQ